LKKAKQHKGCFDVADFGTGRFCAARRVRRARAQVHAHRRALVFMKKSVRKFALSVASQ